MPHLTISGCHIEKQISEINIHVDMKFSRIAWQNRKKCAQRMKEFEEKVETLLMEYFDIHEITGSEWHSNHEWNTRMNNY